MARTESNFDLSLGSTCPAFELQDAVSGRAFGREDVYGGIDDERGRKGLVVAFLCVHCPYVKHLEEAFASIANEFAEQVAFVAISSNDTTTYPEDAPEHMHAQAERLGWKFPYLYDESQATAREFHAACTPDLYLFDHEYRLVYHGQFDGTRPYRQSDAERGLQKDSNLHQAANGVDLRRAIEALLRGDAPLSSQTPCLGCGIKWRMQTP